MNDSDFLPFVESQRKRVSEVKNAHNIYRKIETFGATGGKSEDESSTVQGHISSGRIATIRKLNMSEIEILKNVCICQCDDWSSVYLMVLGETEDGIIWDRQLVEDALKVQVKNCSFSGFVVLGIDLNNNNGTGTGPTNLDPTKRHHLKPGVHKNTLISNSIIEPGATVYDNSIIVNCVIGSNATVLNCGSISTSLDKSFSDLMTVGVGPEAGGGRPISVIPESSMIDVCSSLGMNMNSSDDAHARVRVPSKLLGKSTDLTLNIIHGDVLHVKVASNLFVSQRATIQSCSSVDNAILLPSASIQNSIASKIFLQWNSSIINNSNVSDTLLMECSEIGPNSVVASTVLGPDSHVSCGEVHCSVIGPNTNSHHQSLLISVLWPTGRGNVGYGSNIGSNHTGRIPDQECTVGEGVFWGLGSVIKFPVDLSKSYYSVVAAGVQLPPQSVAIPFSLIMNGDPKVSGVTNEIVPGWLLQSSPYTVLRSSVKFRERRKAKRHGFYCGWDIIRPLIVDTCIDVRDDLVAFERSREGAEHKSLLIIGQNYVSSRGLSVGIKAYTNMIHRYALGGLLAFLQECLENGIVEAELGTSFYRTILVSQQNRKTSKGGTKKISWPCLPWEEDSHGSRLKLLQHKMEVLAAELPSIVDTELTISSASHVCITCLQKLSKLEGEHAKQVLRSKARDDNRGVKTIPGYTNSHVHAKDDPIVKLAEADAVKVVSNCDKIIALLSWDNSKL